MGLWLLKVNFPWLGLVGLLLGVTLPAPGSFPGERTKGTDGETVASVTLARPGLTGLGLSGVVGETRPWIVLETRAETVTKLSSGGAAGLCGLADATEPSDETELAAERRGFAPFTDTAPAPLAVTVGDVAAEGEEGFGLPDARGVEAPGWTGGRGARYLTLADCD